MKTISFLIGLLSFITITLNAQTKWTYDPAHSSISFTIEHMVISEVTGNFTKFDGSVISDQEDFSDAEIEFIIDASSINTDNVDRDNHLKSADFFDVAKYPEIKFKSKELVHVKDKNYILNGTIEMHGVSKPIKLNVILGGIVKDPYGNTKAGFKILGKLNRKDFGLGWNMLLEAGGVMVGEEVLITGRIQIVKS